MVLQRLRRLVDYLRANLWVVPTASSIVGGALALLMLRIQSELSPEDVAATWWLYSGSARDAGDLLGALLGSLFTMTTLAISITMVVLTLAANQLGPRLIRSFISDRRTQISLGLFVGTIIYVLLVLRTMHDNLSDDAVPRAAISLGSGLSLLCLIILVVLVHHLARSIVADDVIERVGVDLDHAIRAALPPADAVKLGQHEYFTPIGAPRRLTLEGGGYVQAVDFDSIVRAAGEAQAMVRLAFRPGDHVIPGTATIEIWSPPAADHESLEGVVQRAVIFGSQRTPTQDVEFSVRQLVEVALRALSPGINDPYTAIAVIDRLAFSLTPVAVHGTKSGAQRDRDQIVRLIAPTSTFEGLVDRAFDQIRQAGEAKPDILIRMLEAIRGLVTIADDGARRDVLMRQARMIVAAARRNVDEPGDLDRVEERFVAIAQGDVPEAPPERDPSGTPRMVP